MITEVRRVASMDEGDSSGAVDSRKLLRNFGALTLGKLTGDGFLLLFFVALSRAYGPDGLGIYSFAIALTGFMAIVADFGLFSLSIKEMSGRPEGLGEYFSKVFTLRILISSIILLAFVLVLSYVQIPSETKIMLLLVGLYQVGLSLADGSAAVFAAREEMHFASLIQLYARAIGALLAIGVIISGGNLAYAIAPLPVATLGVALWSYRRVSRRYGPFHLAASWSDLKALLAKSQSYAASSILRQFAIRVELVFVGLLLGANALGVYSAAFRVVFFIIVFGYFGALTVFPTASRLYRRSQGEFGELYHASLSIAILIGVPAAAGLWLVTPQLVWILYGADFTESAVVLRFLSPLLPIAFLASLMAVFMTSSDRQPERTRVQWVAAWAAVLGSLLLIPRYGVVGAAAAVVISEMLMVGLFATRLNGVVGWPQVGLRLAASGIASACFLFLFGLLPSLPIALVIPSAVVIYVAVLYAFKDIRRTELGAAASLLHKEFRVAILRERDIV